MERDVPFALIVIYENVSCYFTWQPFCPGCIYIIWCLLFIAVQLPTRIWPFPELHVPTS